VPAKQARQTAKYPEALAKACVLPDCMRKPAQAAWDLKQQAAVVEGKSQTAGIAQ